MYKFFLKIFVNETKIKLINDSKEISLLNSDRGRLPRRAGRSSRDVKGITGISGSICLLSVRWDVPSPSSEFRRERGRDLGSTAHSLAINETPFSFTSRRTLSRIIRAMWAKISRGRRRARESCATSVSAAGAASLSKCHRTRMSSIRRPRDRLHNARIFYLRRAKNVILLHHALRLYTELIVGNKIVIGVAALRPV